jgi:hypothetical protein
MNLEIHNPELIERLNAQIRSRRLDSADDLIERALDALDEKSPAPSQMMTQTSLHDFFMNSPLRGSDIDLERPRDYPRESDLE